jgi:hypothetical protein
MRNDTLNRVAFTAGLAIARSALQEEEVTARLTDAARTSGLDSSEIEKTIQGAIIRAHQQHISVRSQSGAPISPRLDRSANGSIKATYKNALIALAELGIQARRDTFADTIVLDNAPGTHTLANDHVGTLHDNALVFLRHEIQSSLGFDPGADHLHSAVAALAEGARFNPVIDWLDGLKWDGKPRLSQWLPQVAGAPSDQVYGKAGELLIIGMVARARHPGTKFDLCPVLEGEQGSGKSTLVRSLASGPGDSYFADTPGLIGMDSKERAELLSGKWLVELAELSGLARSETENVKAFLSQSSDRFRPAYARVAVDRQRSCLFVATTNARTYLSDATGNRRFLPIRCGAIDIPALIAIRDVLFAEADHVLRELIDGAKARGIRVEDTRPLPIEVSASLALPSGLWSHAADLTEERRVTDSLEEAVRVVVERIGPKAIQLPNGAKFLSSADLLSNLRMELQGPVQAANLGAWMGRLGWAPTKTGPRNARVRGYAKQ